MSNSKQSSNSTQDNSVLRIGGQGSLGINDFISNNYQEWVESHVKKIIIPKYGIEIVRLVKTHVPYVTRVPEEEDYLPTQLVDPLLPYGPVQVIPHTLTAAQVLSLRIKCIENFSKKKFEIECEEGPRFYSELMNCMSTGSLAAITSHPDFNLAELTSNFSLLWSIIRRTHMTEYRGGNPQAVTREINQMSFEFIGKRQANNVTLDEHYREFKQTRERLTLLGVAAPPAIEQVHHFLLSLDKKRYQSLLDDFSNSVNKGLANVYPTTLVLAYEIASRWIPPTLTSTNMKSSQQSSVVFVAGSEEKSSARKKKPKSLRKVSSHPSSAGAGEKDVSKPPKFSFEGDRRTCTLCGNKGHTVKYCGYNEMGLYHPTEEDAKANKEFMKKVRDKASSAVLVAKKENREDSEGESDDEDEASAFMLSNKRRSNNKKQVLLDCAAGQSIFKDLSLLSDIIALKTTSLIKGIQRGSSGIQIMSKGTFLDLGSVNYSPQSVANLLSFSTLIDNGCTINYIQSNDEYKVKSPNGITYMFSRHVKDGKDGSFGIKSGFYTLDDTTQYVNLATVTDTTRRFTTREIKLAERGKEFMRKLGHVPPTEAINILKSGINNSLISPADITNSVIIHGHPIANLKGSTKHKTSKIIGETLAPRVVQVEQHLDVDIMFVKKIPFLVGVATPLDLTMCCSLKSRSIQSVREGLSKFLSQLSSRNFTSVQIRVDGEGAIASLSDELQLMHQLNVHRAGSGEHVPVVERKIQTIKNSVRSHEHSLPYVMCRTLIIYCVLFCVSRLNLRTNSHFMDKTSPWEQFSGMKLDVTRDLRCGFGDYLQCTVPTTNNSMEARTDGCIALLPNGNLSGSVKVMILRTGRVITRDQFKVLPMPNEVIELLNDKAAKEGYQRGTEPDYDIQPVQISLDNDDAIDQHDPLPHMQLIDNPYVNEAIETEDGTEPSYNANEEVFQDDRIGGDRLVNDRQQEVRTTEPPLRPLPILLPTASTSTTRSGRQVKLPSKLVDYTLATRLSYKSALKQRPVEALKAINSELQQMITMEVWHPVQLSSLSSEERKSIIRSSMFLKDKFSSSGLFLLFKARLVAGGDMQNKLLYDLLYSPTAASSSFFILSTIAAKEERFVEVVDVVGAYLNASLESTGVIVYMRIDKDLSTMLIQLDPSYKKYLDPKGCLIVQLDKALYGCVEASKMWYENLTSKLNTYGFIPNPYDPCLMNINGKSGHQMSILIHVDDILITSKSSADIEHLKSFLRSVYPEIKSKSGPVVDYLGMQLDLTSPGEAVISMDQYVKDLLTTCGVTKKASTPARENLFELPSDSQPATEAQSVWFHSNVAKMLYLSKRTYPECLGVVGFLSTRVNSCTNHDISKLSRLLSYVVKHPQQRLVLRTSSRPFRTYMLADASYGIHADHKSQSASNVGIGDKDYYGATVQVKSNKQTQTAKSSGEAELISASDQAGELLHADRLMRAQGYTDMEAPILYQDNTSALDLIDKGRPISSRSRHIDLKDFWLHEKQDLGLIVIHYLPTKDMYINVLTKPLQGSQFVRERNALTRWTSTM